MKCKICCIENELKLSVLLLCSVIVNRNWIELSKVYIYYYYYFYYYHYHYILLRNKVVVVYCLNDWPGKWTFVLPIFQHCLTWYFLSKYWFFQEKGNYEDSLCISYFGVLHTASSRYVTNITLDQKSAKWNSLSRLLLPPEKSPVSSVLKPQVSKSDRTLILTFLNDFAVNFYKKIP